jgi:O-antigen/teichoic acid export membrane protein
MFLILFWTFFGIILSIIIILLLFNTGIISQSDKLLKETIFLVFPIFIGLVLFEIGAALSKSLLKSTLPIFLKEFFLRFNVMIIILLYWYELIDFQIFIKLYAGNYILIFIILYLYLYSLKIFKFNFSFSLLFNNSFKPLYTYAIFSILSSGAAMILLNIDTLMIKNFLTLKDVAIYGPSIYIASSIVIPSRALQSIIAPVIAQSWATKSKETISILYKKSAISPLIISIFLFLAIWINIDLVMSYFGKTFGQGKLIILFLSIGHIINIATGINGTIINTSKHYRADLYFQVSLVIMTIIMNIIFIPRFGLNGAALATAITLSLHNSLKSIYVYSKFKIHPFSINTLYAFILAILFFVAINNLPTINNLLTSSIIYTIAVSIIYWVIVYYTNISEDINEQIKRIFNILF